MALGRLIGDDLKPQFLLKINDYEISEGVAALITTIEYDSTDEGSADMMKLTVKNPNLEVSNKKLFQCGNTLKLWGGYSSPLEFIGGVIIEKIRPTFPAGGSTPSLEIVGYSADRLMMRNSPPPVKDGKPFLTEKEQEKQDKKDRKAVEREERRTKIKRQEGKTWPEDSFYSDAIADKAKVYSFREDIDRTPRAIVGPLGVFQKQSLTDYQFVAGISNELGWLFWVDADPDGPFWTLHFKDPDTTATIQNFKYDFKYNSGDETSLISFDGEQLMGNGPVELSVQIKNTKTGKLESYSITAEDGVDVQYAGEEAEDLSEAPRTPQEVTISFGNVAVQTFSDRTFQSPAQVKQWADRWFEENKHFFTGSGVVKGLGVEKLRARQVHAMSGLSDVWDGDYYFTNVNLKWNNSTGLVCTWNGRKIPPNEGSDGL